MPALKATILCLLFWCVSACGSQLVEFPLPVTDDSTAAPTVISTWPLRSATAVPLTTAVSATFSRAMDFTSVIAAFGVMLGSTPVAGAMSLDAETNTVTFTPDAPLVFGASYNATVTTQAVSSTGQALEVEYSWSFTISETPPIFDVVSATAAVEAVPAADYALDVAGLGLLTDAQDVVQSATGTATLTRGSVPGQSYVVSDLDGLDTYAEVDAAYDTGATRPVTESTPATTPATVTLPAGDFALVDADLTTPELRTLIVANSVSGVRSYQLFAITFNAAPRLLN